MSDKKIEIVSDSGVGDSEEKSTTSKRVKYRALVGLDFEDKRVEAGEEVEDLPEDSVKWLLEGNYIRRVS